MSRELTFLESYIYLLKERFGENLDVQINIQEKYLDQHIVPLSLQMLVENAIKHNIASSQHPLHIEIGIDTDEQLFVKNNLQKKEQLTPSNKIGLQNIMNRYQLIANQRIKIDETVENFIVKLPLLSLKLIKTGH